MTLSEILKHARTGNFRELVRLLEIKPNLIGIPYIVAAIAVGFTAVLYSSTFGRTIHLAQDWARAHPYVFAACSPLLIMLSSWIVARFAPEAGGTGVPQVMAALEREAREAPVSKIHRRINLRVAGVTVASSLIAIIGGAGLGREGPIVLIGACVFYAVGNAFRRIFPGADHRSWIVAGGAAGIAAAFQTPLAGVIFVVEEMAQEHFHAFKGYIITAVIIAGMIAQWLFGRYLFLGDVKIAEVPFTAVFFAVAVGLHCGIIAAAFEKTLGYFRQFTTPFLTERRLFTAGFLGLAVAALAVYEPRTIGGGIAIIEHLLFEGGTDVPWHLVFTRFAGPMVAHLAGCSGGFLAPSLALGALIGSKFALVFHAPLHNLFVMCGMAAFLGATNRAPFTALVIVMEMTFSHTAIFPLMISAVVGYGTVRYVVGADAK